MGALQKARQALIDLITANGTMITDEQIDAILIQFMKDLKNK